MFDAKRYFHVLITFMISSFFFFLWNPVLKKKKKQQLLVSMLNCFGNLA